MKEMLFKETDRFKNPFQRIQKEQKKTIFFLLLFFFSGFANSEFLSLFVVIFIVIYLRLLLNRSFVYRFLFSQNFSFFVVKNYGSSLFCARSLLCRSNILRRSCLAVIDLLIKFFNLNSTL